MASPIATREVLLGVDPATAAAGDFAAVEVFSWVGSEPVTGLPVLQLVHLDRRQGLRVTQVSSWIAQLADWLVEQGAAGVTIGVDASGLGRPLVQGLQDRLKRHVVLGLILTGSDGQADRWDPTERLLYRAKNGLIAGLDRAFQNHRLKIAAKSQLAEQLLKELQALRATISRSGRLILDGPNPQFAKFDDLAMCAAQSIGIVDWLWTPATARLWRSLRPEALEAPAPVSLEPRELLQ